MTRNKSKNEVKKLEYDSDETYCSDVEKSIRKNAICKPTITKKYKHNEPRRSGRKTQQTQKFQISLPKPKRRPVSRILKQKINDNEKNKPVEQKINQRKVHKNKDKLKINMIENKIKKWKKLINGHIELEKDIREKISSKIIDHMESIQPMCSKTDSTRKGWEKLCESFQRVLKSSTKNCSDYETCKTNLENLKNNFQTVRKQPVQVDNIGKTIFYDHDYETFAKDILSETETFNVNSEDGITEMEIISDSNINDFGNIENENLNLNFIGDNENINQKSIEIDTDLLTPGVWAPIKNNDFSKNNLDLLIDTVNAMSEFQQIDNATTEFNTISALNENPEDNQVVKDLDFQNRIDFNKKCEPVRQVINNINDTKLQLQICNKTVPATDENNLSQELIQTPECVEIDLSNTGPFPRTPSHINTQMKTTQSINNTNINNVIILESQIDRQNICAQENSQIKLLENLQMLSINTSEKTKIQHSKPNESMTQLSDIIPSTQFEMEPKNHTKINKNNQNKTVETKEIQKSPYDWVKTIKAVIQPSKHQFMPRNILPEAFWLNPFAELPPEWKNDFDTW